MPTNAPPATVLLIPHPYSGLVSRFVLRVESLAAAAVMSQALRARIERHELN